MGETKPKDYVKELVLRHIEEKPRRISLKLAWEPMPWEPLSLIKIGDHEYETERVVDFTSFGDGVVEAFMEAFGELRENPMSFRETIYRNGDVEIDLYPTGSAGIFDIFIRYRDSVAK